MAEATARDSLASVLGLGEIDEDDLYAAMDWLLERQDRIERRLAKHFELDIAETSFSYQRKAEDIAAEAALDGLYVVRTSVPEALWMPRKPCAPTSA